MEIILNNTNNKNKNGGIYCQRKQTISGYSRTLVNFKMAGVSECFSIGSIVACKTCFSKEIEGEVLAFDPQTKMLILSILFI